jgi:hypothetical protein
MPQSGPKNSASEATPAATSSDEAKLKAAALCLDKSDEQGNAQSSALFAAFQVFRAHPSQILAEIKKLKRSRKYI